MNKFFKRFLLLTFVFVLTRLQMGTGTVYYSGDGSQTTTDVNQAARYETLGEVYDMQNKLGADWNIEVI